MLSNTVYKLTKEKKLNVVYFGGSILDGACSTDHEKTSCRALTTEWLKKTYPKAEINAFNACIGGTGTGFGAFRLGKDVLSHRPDLIFIEFATNDWEDDYFKILMQTESILRKIRKECPFADTVMVMATDDDITDVTDTGIEYESRTAHAAAAHHYGVPVTDPGEATYAWLLKNKSEKDALSPDRQHPNDLGYRVMADALISWLGNMFEKASHPGDFIAHSMPRMLCSEIWDGPDMVYCEEEGAVTYSGFEFRDAPDTERVKKYLYSEKAGDEITFEFEGAVFGIYWIAGFLSSNVLVSIDGKKEKEADSWDNHFRSFQRLRAAIVFDSLSEGKHKAVIKVKDVPGAKVGIGGFFICR